MKGWAVTVSGNEKLVDAPGAGLFTLRDPVPWFCKSDAVKVTFSEVVLTTTVGLGEPFHKAVEFD